MSHRKKEGGLLGACGSILVQFVLSRRHRPDGGGPELNGKRRNKMVKSFPVDSSLFIGIESVAPQLCKSDPSNKCFLCAGRIFTIYAIHLDMDH